MEINDFEWNRLYLHANRTQNFKRIFLETMFSKSMITVTFFLISDDPVTSCSDQGKTLFFGPLANLLYPTFFSIFSYKKFMIPF